MVRVIGGELVPLRLTATVSQREKRKAYRVLDARWRYPRPVSDAAYEVLQAYRSGVLISRAKLDMVLEAAQLG